MDGIWIKKCPQCGNYFKKSDPAEAGTCCSCGWQEGPAESFLSDA